MPSKPSKTAEPGFLRKFHFSTIGPELVTKLLGAVEKPPWLGFQFQSVPEPLTRVTRFVTEIVVSPHAVFVVEAARRPLGDPTRCDQTISRKRPGRRVHTEFSLADVALKDSRNPYDVVCRGLEGSLLNAGRLLYEYDPRLGWRWSPDGSQRELPACPLFDPRGPLSRTGVPLALKGGPSDYRPLPFHEPRCPFCQKKHSFDDPPLWAGGSLMWVHKECWRVS